MQFIAGLLIFSLFFVLIFVIGLVMVFRKTWLLVWLRANLGIGFLFFGIFGCVGLFLLSDLEPLQGEVNFGQVEVRALPSGVTFMRLSNNRLGEREIELTEPSWRLRAIQLKWTGSLPMFGLNDGVLLYDIQESNALGVTSSTIVEHAVVVDLWSYARQYLQWIPGVEFEFLSTEWYPKTMNTVYDLRVTKAGLTLHDDKTPARPGTAQVLFEKSALNMPVNALESTTSATNNDEMTDPETQSNESAQ